MKRTGHVPFMRLKIGIFVMVAVVLLLWATFQSGGFRFGRRDHLEVRFSRVGGLEEGAAVRLHGVPVGLVKEIELAPKSNDVAVKMELDEGTKKRLYQGSTARITTVGFLAELYVELDGGDPSRSPIQNDGEVRTALISDPAMLMNDVQATADTVQILLTSLTTTVRGIERGEGTLGRLARDERLYENLTTLSRDASTLTRDMNANQTQISARLVSLTTSLDSLAKEMQHGEGTMAQLMRNPALYDHLASSTARLDSILAVVESGKGTFGRMMSDTLLYDDTKALMASMKRLMQQIEKDPKKYFKFSIF
ncbi:MAG TPA: MlaD family protein [Candidatus Eisenbacteria bacterium]|nr:MlaD family protein [Candidatus Eisenbacteria bacterium]